MKKQTLSILTALLLLTSSIVWGADFQKGLAAYKKGDFAVALAEWQPLAEQGDSSAQFNLGLMYNNGQGVIQDYKAAIKWYTLAAQQGIAGAQFNLGLMYQDGQGVIQDYKTAIKWYTLAAQQGVAFAQFNLGVGYYKGKGAPQNNVFSYMWFSIAALSGELENASKARDIVAKDMTAADISKAQELARECVQKQYKGCTE